MCAGLKKRSQHVLVRHRFEFQSSRRTYVVDVDVAEANNPEVVRSGLFTFSLTSLL